MSANAQPSAPPLAAAVEAGAVLVDVRRATLLGKVIASPGSADFFPALLDFIGSICPMHSGGTMIFSRHAQPRLLTYRRRPSATNVLAQDYFSGPYILDPNYQRFLAGCDSGAYWLRDVAPDDFYSSEFYRLFYSQLGLADYVDILWRIDADTALSVFLERDTSGSGFRVEDIAAINAILPVVFAAVERHHHQAGLASLPSGGGDDNLTHQKVQSSIENFGGSLLTKREREVLFYMLSGYSAALTADRMGSTEGTVKIHRKSIHRKLEIGSQAELFALFIRCIPYATPEAQIDPLTAYQTLRPVGFRPGDPG